MYMSGAGTIGIITHTEGSKGSIRWQKNPIMSGAAEEGETTNICVCPIAPTAMPLLEIHLRDFVFFAMQNPNWRRDYLSYRSEGTFFVHRF